jgi:hypothetical protein
MSLFLFLSPLQLLRNLGVSALRCFLSFFSKFAFCTLIVYTLRSCRLPL